MTLIRVGRKFFDLGSPPPIISDDMHVLFPPGKGAPSPARRWIIMDSETAGRYRKEAQQIRKQAEIANNDAIRRQLLAIAESYEGLAETVLILSHQNKGLSD